MSGFKVLGIGLILLGFAMLVTGEFSYKKRDKVVDTGVVDITANKQRR